MSLYNANWKTKSSRFLFYLSIAITTSVAAYLHSQYGLISGVACYIASILSLCAGAGYQGELWMAWDRGDRRRKLIQNEIEMERQGINAENCLKPDSDDAAAISGPTFERLQRAIAAFPARYPEYRTRPPKLDGDVRPWLKEVGIANNEREAHIFGAIIAEHFKFSPDALRSL